MSIRFSFVGFLVIVLSVSVTFAASSFSDIVQNELVSRYEFAQLVQDSLCLGCTDDLITQEFRDTYTAEWLESQKAIPGTNIADIRFESADYQGTDYYYCVAASSDSGIVSGYDTSDTFCQGEFCGEQLVTWGEVIDAVEALVDQDDANAILVEYFDNDIFSPASGPAIGDILHQVNQIVGCKNLQDFDVDTVLNSVDNCPYWYNPEQKDSDADQVGDVCDDDVVVLESKNSIGATLRVDNQYGPASFAADFLLVGDTFSDYRVTWSFGDGRGGVGSTQSKTFEEPGVFTTTATVFDGSVTIATASAQIVVVSSPQEQVGYQITAEGSNELYAEQSFVTDLFGQASQVTWSVANIVTNSPVSEPFTYRFEQTGRYVVESQVYNDNGDRVALAQTTHDVADPNSDDFLGSTALQASSLAVQPGGTITFSTIISDIQREEINKINWYFGDDTAYIDGDITIEKQFTSPGVYRVRQGITFVNRKRSPHENILTIVVLEDDTPPVMSINFEPYTGSINESFSAQIDATNINQSSVVSVDWDRGDDFSQQVSTLEQQTHAYQTAGQYIVSATVTLDDGTVRYADGTVGVSDETSCILGEDYVCDMDGDEIPDMCDEDIDGDSIRNWDNLLKQEPENCDYGPRYDFTYVNESLFNNYTNWIQRGGPGDNCFLDPNSPQVDDDEDGYGNVCDSIDDSEDDGSDDAGGDSAGGDSSGSGGGGDGESSCGDGIDEDGDGLIDCADPDCASDPACQGGGSAGSASAGSASAGSASAGSASAGSASAGSASAGSASAGSADDGSTDDGSTDDGSTDDGGGSAGPQDDDQDDRNPFVEVEVCKACPCPKADYGSSLWKGDRVRALLYDEGGAILYRKSEPNIIEVDIPKEMLGG